MVETPRNPKHWYQFSLLAFVVAVNAAAVLIWVNLTWRDLAWDKNGPVWVRSGESGLPNTSLAEVALSLRERYFTQEDEDRFIHIRVRGWPWAYEVGIYASANLESPTKTEIEAQETVGFHWHRLFLDLTFALLLSLGAASAAGWIVWRIRKGAQGRNRFRAFGAPSFRTRSPEVPFGHPRYVLWPLRGHFQPQSSS